MTFAGFLDRILASFFLNTLLMIPKWLSLYIFDAVSFLDFFKVKKIIKQV